MKINIHRCSSRNKFPFNIGSILIKFFSGTDYSHYAISFIAMSGREMFFHSNFKGVHLETKSRFLSSYDIKQSSTVEPKISYAGIYSFVDNYLGAKYGFMQVFGLFLITIGILKNNPFGSNKIICNELIVMMLDRFYDLNIDDFDGINFKHTEEIIGGIVCQK